MPERVIQAALPCTDVLHARNLETGEEAIILTTRFKRPHNWRWSWSVLDFVLDKAAYDREYNETVRKPLRAESRRIRELQSPSDHP